MMNIDPYRERERKIRKTIEEAQRVIRWMANKGILLDETKAYVEHQLELAEMWVSADGDIYFPKEHWLDRAEEAANHGFGILQALGWVKNEYEPSIGWRP